MPRYRRAAPSTALDEPVVGAEGAGEFANRSTISQAQLLRPFPQFGNISRGEQTEAGRRNYNAFVLKLDKRTGGSFWGGRMSYTWSSTKDNQWNQTSGFANRLNNGVQNNYDIDVGEYGTSIFDSPHRILLAPIVRIPGPG